MKSKIFGFCFLLLLPSLIQAKNVVGVRILQEPTLTAMIWYPAEASGETVLFGYYGLVKGQAVLNALPQAGRHPLLVFSHGLGMCSFQSVFLMEFLAANGYIVVAPDHNDAAMCHIGGVSDVTNCQLTKSLLKSTGSLDKSVQLLFPDKLHYLNDPAYRPKQISLAIDWLLADPQWSVLIAADKIGVMGHSFGGWTAEAVAGAEIDCRNPESYAPEVCEAPEKGLSTSQHNRRICCQPPYQGQISNFRDSRVRAVLALGPGSFIFPNYEAMNNQVPVMIILGDHLEVDFAVNGYGAATAMQAPVHLVVWRQVGHMTASDLVFAKPGAPLLRQYWFYKQKQQLYQDWSLGFFRAYLQGDFSLLQKNLERPCWLKLYWEEN